MKQTSKKSQYETTSKENIFFSHLIIKRSSESIQKNYGKVKQKKKKNTQTSLMNPTKFKRRVKNFKFFP